MWCGKIKQKKEKEKNNGEIAFHAWTDEKRVYSLDTFHGAWTSLQLSICPAYDCNGCGSAIAEPI